jgi:hypothetical protein
MQSDSNRMPGTRKPYEAPRLRVYGDVGEITRNVSMKGNLDGGTGNDKSNP